MIADLPLTLTNTQDRKLKVACIMNTMRILKKVNPGDAYYEAYLGHLARSGDDFYDTYILMWELAASHPPKRILEIGSRTGISLCQLLSGYVDHSKIEKIITCDIFSDNFTSPALIRKNLAYLNLPWEKVEILKGSSIDLLPRLRDSGETFDYILVDGDHEQTAAFKDLQNAHEVLEPGGFLLFDDISTAPGECALIEVWTKFEEQHENEYTFFSHMSGKGVGLGVKK